MFERFRSSLKVVYHNYVEKAVLRSLEGLLFCFDVLQRCFNPIKSFADVVDHFSYVALIFVPETLGRYL